MKIILTFKKLISTTFNQKPFMKNNYFLLFFGLFFYSTLTAQITKSNWMVGGDATFLSNKTDYGTSVSKTTSFSINPNIGYFIIDKLAVGASVKLAYIFESNANTSNNSFNYGIGPFVRYYFLETEKPLNIFSEVSYNIERINNIDSKIDSFKIKAGAVYFLNNSVGIEVALNYLNQKNNTDIKNNAIFLGVGFQIHLEKE